MTFSVENQLPLYNGNVVKETFLLKVRINLENWMRISSQFFVSLTKLWLCLSDDPKRATNQQEPNFTTQYSPFRFFQS